MSFKVAVLGCGRRAMAHLHAWRQMEPASSPKVVLAHDPRGDIAEHFVSLAGEGRIAESIEDVVAERELDAAFICLPPHLSPQAAMLCARRDLPFFVEMPICLSLEEFRPVEREIEERYLLTSVGASHRYSFEVLQLVEHLTRFPPLACHMCWLIPPPPASQWYGQPLEGGGLLNVWGSQLIDLARYMFGEPQAVWAIGQPIPPPVQGVPEEGVVQVTMSFDERMSATLLVAASRAVQQPCLEVRLVTRDNVLSVHSRRLELRFEEDDLAAVNSLRMQSEVFMAAVRNRDASNVRCSYQDAGRTQAVVSACRKSMGGNVLRHPTSEMYG